MMDIPRWFWYQEPENSGFSFTMPATVPTSFIGIILWFNISCRTPTPYLSDFWAQVIAGTSFRNSWSCRTSLWKEVSQSWVSFIPQKQFPLYANERVSVRVKSGPLESIGAHLVYI